MSEQCNDFVPGDREGEGGQLGNGVDGVGLKRNREDGHEAAAVADSDDEDAEDPQTDHNSCAGAAQPAHPHLVLLQHSSKHEICTNKCKRTVTRTIS